MGYSVGWYTPSNAKYTLVGRPIANKYRKGKMQRTLKRESKELEVVRREAIAKLAQGAGLNNDSLFSGPFSLYWLWVVNVWGTPLELVEIEGCAQASPPPPPLAPG